ncbi:MAG: Holliday junction resolvase RuvX [Cyanobacteria bacterium P01_E01_bin.6]
MTTLISALGLDIGRKRIGVAGCDGLGLVAVGLTTIERRSYEHVISQLRQFVDERSVTVLVIGLPYMVNGELGSQARQVTKFARRLEATLQLPVEYVDERFTSLQAEELMHAEHQSPSRNKAMIDRKAAAIILQRWLDER